MADPSISSTDKHEPWEAVNNSVEKLTNSVCGSWSGELSNLLIFASLFSAIVTAFTIEAAKAIQADPAEQTVLLLRTLILQVNNISNPQSNLPVNLTYGDSVTITPHAQQIYLFYSVSLALSLISVLGGITSLQWLREFNQNVTGVSPSTDIYVQYQRHKSLKQWRVLTLLNTLPVLLVVSLFLFFAGFLTSQWELGALAATPVSVLVGIAALFILITSFLPALQVVWLADCTTHESVGNPPDAPLPHPVLCPYRSPQAWLALSFLHCLLRVTQYISFNKVNPLRLMPFSDMDSWAGYDKWWIEKHKTEKSIYPALFWVATEFNQSKDAVLMAYQCLIASIADTYCEYLKTMPRNEMIPDSTTWSAFGFSTISHFENQFISDKPMLVWNTYLGAFSRIWEVVKEKDLKVKTSNDIYQILRVQIASETDRTALLKSISNSLSHPGNVWITEEIAVAAACHAIDQDSWNCNDPIAILKEMCKRYLNDRSVYLHIRNFCNKLRERLTSEHQCKDLLIIFNGIFRTGDSINLGNLGYALRALLVRCPTCYIPYWRAEEFLKIIDDLASQRLIAKDHSLDDILRYTAHVIRRSSRLHLILPSIETTLTAILSVAEEHARLSTSTSSVLHPSRFSIPHTVPHPDYPNNNLKPVWDLTDKFNNKLKEIWEKREGTTDNGSGQGSTWVDERNSCVRNASGESGKTREKEVQITQIARSSNKISPVNERHRPTKTDAWGIELEGLTPMISSSPLQLRPSTHFIENLSDEPESSSNQPVTNNNLFSAEIGED